MRNGERSAPRSKGLAGDHPRRIGGADFSISASIGVPISPPASAPATAPSPSDAATMLLFASSPTESPFR